jgi:hypothetical protein
MDQYHLFSKCPAGRPFDAIVRQLSEKNSINATGVLVRADGQPARIRVTGAMATVRTWKPGTAGQRHHFPLGDFAAVKREFTDPPKDRCASAAKK